ncbi:MAG: PIN/TRAM domain-containing protein, partial [Thermotogae bacterium]|nr:PIN/TRAM domain-containing protein [Thermotogota bacterium]
SFMGAWIIAQRSILSMFKVGEISGNYGSFIFDTSVLLDDKLLDLFDIGLFNGKIVIPQFVLIEMQKLADSSDDEKKDKGRKGFEIIEKMQGLDDLKVTIDDSIAYRTGKVDEDLVNLARKYNGRLVTLDYNSYACSPTSGCKSFKP